MKKALFVAASATLVLGISASGAFAQPPSPVPEVVTPVTLTPINGWTSAPFGTSVSIGENVTGVVHFKGAIATSGTNPVAFILPNMFRPATDVYVPVDMCNATNGRLYIQHNGTVSVQAETSFSNAQCFTSLDGAAYARNATGYTPVTLVNGWTNAPFSTSNAAFKVNSNFVQFKGAIGNGTSGLAFTLPAADRPLMTVYIPIDLCNATNGRLIITPNGNVTVQAQTSFANAQCFTSLEDASFAKNLTGITPLTLINGWTNAPFSTRIAGFKVSSGIVHFTGAIATSGTNPNPFMLPGGARPAKNAYVKVDLCNATNGRLFITHAGVVTVQAATFSNAQCFTSLEGVTFVK